MTQSRSAAMLEIAAELRPLQLTADIVTAYERLLEEMSRLNGAIRWAQIPVATISALGRMALQAKEPQRGLIGRLESRNQDLTRWVVISRHLIWTERLFAPQITEEYPAARRGKVFELLKEADFPYEVIETWLRPYRRRPVGPPAKKRSLYLVALDYKRSHPDMTWPALAKKYCSSHKSSATLKAWGLRTKKKLTEIGVQLDLKNPRYQNRSSADSKIDK